MNLQTLILSTALVLVFVLCPACTNKKTHKKGGPEPAREKEANRDTGNDAETTSSGELDLPPKFRSMLRQEMVKIESGMNKLFSHLIRGRKTEAARVSMNIHESFILKQKLSKKELKTLQTLLPEEFVKLDRRFHKQAKQLSDAAKAGMFDRAMSLYNSMSKSCVSCHSRFASNRFPALENEDRGD